jgi:hypothetical protein
MMSFALRVILSLSESGGPDQPCAGGRDLYVVVIDLRVPKLPIMGACAGGLGVDEAVAIMERASAP